MPVNSFFAALNSELAKLRSPCRGHVFHEGAILRIRGDDRHVWSPALHLHPHPHDDGSVGILGRFSPSSPVWTAFVAIYLLLLSIAIACGCYAWAQYLVNEEPWALVGVPICVALAAFTYGAAFIGQGLGAEDMYELRSFVDHVADASPLSATTDAHSS